MPLSFLGGRVRSRSLLQLMGVEDAQTEHRLRVAPDAYSSSGMDVTVIALSSEPRVTREV